VNLIFFKMIFLKKWFSGFNIGLSVLMDFNHCRPIGLSISVPVFDFSNAKFEFGAVVFVVTDHIGGERFLRPYRFFNLGAPTAVKFKCLAIFADGYLSFVISLVNFLQDLVKNRDSFILIMISQRFEMVLFSGK
jgi:hypothetical protein